jgi:hypothetical protein
LEINESSSYESNSFLSAGPNTGLDCQVKSFTTNANPLLVSAEAIKDGGITMDDKVEREMTVQEFNSHMPFKLSVEDITEYNVNEDENSRLADDFIAYIDSAAPADFQDIHDRVLDKLLKMHSRTALRVIAYAKKRLLGEGPKFGRVDDNGDITPFGFGGAS